MKIKRETLAKLISETVNEMGIHDRRVTQYISPTLTIKITRRHKWSRRGRSHELLVTYGKPNYRERKEIKSDKDMEYPYYTIDEW